MVSLTKRRSVMILSVGLVLGILAGFGYWYASPVRFQMGWPPIVCEGFSGSTDLYLSSVAIEPTTYGAAFVAPKDIQRTAEFWAYRMSTATFYDYAMQELGETVPGFTETAEAIHEVLARTAVDPAQVRMITPRIRYTETVTRVEIRVLGQTEEEAIWLAGVMPGLFQNFLIEEELALRLGEYETDLTNSKVVENDLVDARRRLALLPYGGNSTYGDLQASRFEIEAIITALEQQAAIVAGELASITAEGLTGTYEYERTLSQLRRLTQKLAEARIELDRVNAELQGGNANAEHAVAYARVRMLSEQLDAISQRLASPPTVEGVEAQLEDLFLAYDPSLPIVVTEKMRGRNALMIGAVLGVGVAWLGLNRKGLLERLRPSQATASFELPEEEEREDEA